MTRLIANSGYQDASFIYIKHISYQLH